MKLLVILAATALLTSCGSGFVLTQQGGVPTPGADGAPGERGEKGDKGDAGRDGKDYTPPEPTPTEEVVNQLNEIREAQGQAPLTKGLVCTAYTVPNSTTQIIGASLTAVGSFLSKKNLEGMLLPAPMAEVIKTYYIVKCSGQLIVTTSEWREITVASDDGANIYINGNLLNNDGLHAMQSKSYVKFLARGAHSIQVDYFQAAGLSGLQVFLNDQVIPSSMLYH